MLISLQLTVSNQALLKYRSSMSSADTPWLQIPVMGARERVVLALETTAAMCCDQRTSLAQLGVDTGDYVESWGKCPSLAVVSVGGQPLHRDT
ncbi:hypothetical protein ElyMa_005055800 [Elysia marginata]|uniref:Uncharacterized protein n=1 Tax=Elysia marginata TaxID=1093978 RepID=A0AAV4JDJ0_9GAST|nr:hypothetical protein ElyMa_005055800 [Elysia marginata]